MRFRWLPWVVLGLVLVGCSRPETLSPVGEGGAGGDGGAGAGGGAGSDADGDGFPVPDDCDDSDPAIHPDAVEVPYDGSDQDCDGADAIDLDGDGHPAMAAGGDDCDDRAAELNPGASELCGDGVDQDCSGADQPCPGTDRDLDGVTAESGDCNDGDPDIHPGASEIPYDGIDQDCDGSDLVDVDGDGVPGTLAGGDDCDDDERTVHPGAPELCGDGVDQDCSGADVLCPEFDGDGDGYTPVQGDCDDTLASVHPGALEAAYDGIDQDCSGSDLTDVDHDCARALEAGGDDCDDTRADVHPGALEVCGDEIDQNCDGLDPVCPTLVNDGDGDGHADVLMGGDDCDDLDPGIHPGIEEVPWSGVDEDCDGRDQVGSHFALATSSEYADVAFAGSVFLAAWDEFDDTAGTGAVRAQTISADGVPLGTPIQVHASHGWPIVVGGASGFLVAWVEGDYGASPSRIALWAQRFRLDGAPAEPALLLAEDEVISFPRGAFGPGGFLLTWEQGAWAPDYDSSTLEGRAALGAEAGGWTLTPALEDPAHPLLPARLEALAADPDGYLAVFSEGAPGAVDLRALPLDRAGVPAGPSFVVTNHEGSEGGAVVAFDGRNYVVLFGQTEPGRGTWEVWAQFIGRDGTPAFSRTDENLPVARPLALAGGLAALVQRGSIVGIWFDRRAGEYGLYAQALTPDGTILQPGDGTGHLLFGGANTVHPYHHAATDGTCVLAVMPAGQFPYTGISAALLRPPD